MRIREAKDFLVDQIRKQADIDGISLAEPEIQMLYFTEQGGLSAKMQEVVNNFAASYDNATYEKKISHLMKHAYSRIKFDDPPAKDTWDRAIRCLKRGDHYILVMWGGNPLIETLIVLGLAALCVLIIMAIQWIGRTVRPPNPHLLLALFLGLAAFGIFFPRQLNIVFDWFMKNTIDRFLDPEDNKKKEE